MNDVTKLRSTLICQHSKINIVGDSHSALAHANSKTISR